MNHEDDLTPVERLRRRVPQSLEFLLTLVNPVLPSGKRIGPLFLIVFVAVWLAGTFLLPTSAASVFLPFILAITVTLLISSIVHGRSKWEEWRVLRESLATRILRDKTRAAVHGRIHPLAREPFLSPLSGNECVAYVYKISHVYERTHSDSAGKTTITETEFEGIGLTPSFVETKYGHVRLLAWPNFMSRIKDFSFKDGPESMDFQHATRYFRSALIVQANKQDWYRGAGESMKADTGGLQLDVSVGKQSKQDLIGFFAQSLVFKSASSDKWEFTHSTRAVKRFYLYIEGWEMATYRRGTNTNTDKSIFAKINIADRPGAARGGAQVAVPANTMHTFASENNKIVWSIQLRGDIRVWPDVSESFVIEVLPRRLTEAGE